ncbi:M1 family metallopeptidase [Longitalea arenae]|uniref:M1 family metallopeptidase n=1 Tax=Longitalea arenae TaxID=2812558 RepID=UPI001968926C|nr:M1 family metallopeptidase [Longitalea arenae]
MKKFYLLILIVLIGMRGLAQSYWQQEVHYTIDVSLNDREHTLDGFLKLRYINHSPDTLTFIWFHLWPNAFKNDRTAFTEQTLANGNTDFYFSAREKRGYINRLDFRVGNNTVKTEDHPQYIDIVKVVLPAPLLPGQETEITTPFHVQLPANFSRGGHTKHSYQVTQWYPKPAVYDRYGWHPMPYLDQGEFYSEFGSFDVRITVPDQYVVAATGELQNESEKEWLKGKAAMRNGQSTIGNQQLAKGNRQSARGDEQLTKGNRQSARGNEQLAKGNRQSARDNEQLTKGNRQSARDKKEVVAKGVGKKAAKEAPADKTIAKKTKAAKPQTTNHKPQTLASKRKAILTPQTTKTLRYIQNKIHDFAWFADSNFIVQQDTIQLPSGRVVQAMSFYRSAESKGWTNSIQYIKDAVHFRSRLIGEYPYNVVSVVEAKMGSAGGMEYPTITSISPGIDAKQLDVTIEHEVGHNWFYGILANNEREHAWLDEGVNSYYDNRYKALKYPKSDLIRWVQQKIPRREEELLIDALAKIKKDQPIATPSADFTYLNYAAMTYMKTAILLEHLEQAMGTARFDSCMQAYYQQWQFKHPSPADFKQHFTVGDGKAVNAFFDSLQTTGGINADAKRKKLRPAFMFSLKDYDKVNYVNWMPALGYNVYDKWMVGLILHNYTMPAHKLQFFLSPMYAPSSKEFTGLGRVGYTWRPDGAFEKIDLSVSGARFSTRAGVDSNAHKVHAGVQKITPALRFTFANANPRSTVEKWLEWRSFLLWEKNFRYVLKSEDGEFYPTEGTSTHRYLNQLGFNITDYRALYPYDVLLQVQQGEGFYRASATGHYFFNYANSGGLQMRVFAAKFGYLGEKTVFKQAQTSIYQPKLTAVRGNEDYTYSNYFIGRNETDGISSQQIMMRDGGLKLRTDLFQGLQGRSDNWVASMNLNTTLPKGLLPFNPPIKIFFDAGTYAEAWKKNAATSRFLYVAGLQLSLFKDLLQIYAPVLYSKEFRDNLKTVPDENGFFKKLSFSIDVHRFNIRKATGNKIPF